MCIFCMPVYKNYLENLPASALVPALPTAGFPAPFLQGPGYYYDGLQVRKRQLGMHYSGMLNCEGGIIPPNNNNCLITGDGYDSCT